MRWLILYAWNPLPVIEFAGEAHADAPMVFGLALTIAAVSKWPRHQPAPGHRVIALLACTGLAMATLAKAFPIVLAPFLLRIIGWRYALPLGVMLVVGGWPLLSPALIANYVESVQLYYRLFEYNAGLYLALKEVGWWLTGDDVSKTLGPRMGLAYLAFIAVVFALWKPGTASPGRDLAVAAVWLFGGYLVFATTVHPWYVLWVLAPAVLLGRRARPWLWLSCAAAWSYIAYTRDPVHVPAWVTITTWGGFSALLLIDSRWWLIDRIMQLRAASKVRHVAPHAVGSTVLDVGAGDGWPGRRLASRCHYSVTLLDVVDFNRTDLPLVVYDGRAIPFADRSFDTVIVLTALHHCDDPDAILNECVRVCRRRLIITESVYRTEAGRRVLTFLDRLANRMRSGGAMPGPLHFRKVEDWHSAFAARGLQRTKTIWLSRGVHRHVLFVLDRP